MMLLIISCKKDSPKKMQDLLVGKWIGQGASPICTDGPWQASFEIEKSGHYTASVISGPAPTVFFIGFDSLDFPERRFIVYFNDAFEQGHGHANVGTFDNTYTSVEISYMEFSNKNNHLEFKARIDNMYMYYSLDRQ